ncbi:MAG: hypothetical protein JO184_03625 [Gammaproteobacteria bacterium]|nr:hypothetical protein [Gammaproteobacteria bacterium]
MRTTTWAIFGSLATSLVLGLVIAAVLSLSPLASAAAATHCSGHEATSTRKAPPPPARPPQRYIVAVRMGWAM